MELADVDELWEGTRDSIKEVAEEVIGSASVRRKEWLSDVSWQKMEERKELKQRKSGTQSG